MEISLEITEQDFKFFQSFIREKSGIVLDEGKAYLIESRLKGLLPTFSCGSFGDLFKKVRENAIPAIRATVVDALTTNETLWFRDQSPYTILEEVFLPEIGRQIIGGKPLVRIWSAACSTGQEPYSMAMIIAEFCRKLGNPAVTPAKFSILATDISPSVISLAKGGEYDNVSMARGLPGHYKQKYFSESGKGWRIAPALGQTIEFKLFNLLDSFQPLGTFDAIFCRNVAIYFSREFKEELFGKMKQALRPGGIFMLGSSETLAYYSTEFTPLAHQGHTYYRG